MTATALKQFARQLETATNLILPRVGNYIMPRSAIFPSAHALTVYYWDKNGVYYNLDRHHFPNVKRINYISGSPGEAIVVSRFLDISGFVWALPKSPRHHRFFDFVDPKYRVLLESAESETLSSAAEKMQVHKDIWEEYLVGKERELH